MPDCLSIPGHREPPHNYEAEQGLLGAILVNNRAIDRVSEYLEPDHFADPVHGEIYSVIKAKIDQGGTASPITLKGTFEQNESLADIGGAQYLVKLAASVVTVVNAADYGKEIHDCYLRRRLIEIGETVVNDAFDRANTDHATAVLEGAESALFGLVENGSRHGGPRAIGDDIDDAFTHVEAAAKNEGRLLGMSTGIRALDAATGGLSRANLVILAARPSMGKTSLARQIAYRVAETYGVERGPVAFFSLEMSSIEQNLSLLAALSDLSVVDVLHGSIGDAWCRLQEARDRMRGVPLMIDERAALKVSQVRSAARRMKRKHGLSLIVVDYLQLLRPEGKAESQNMAVTEISAGLKALAKELNVPVLALSQLSRQVEQREDKRPVLSDLRDSGSIEQDADSVWFIYREEYYEAKKEPQTGIRGWAEKQADWRERMDKVKGKAEILIAKRRMGPIGKAEILFKSKTTSFGDPF